MKFLGVSGVFDYAGPNRSSRYRACSYCLPHITRASASGLTVYGAEYPPRLSSVYASLGTSRYPAQDSRPSGSLLLSRKELSSSASCRFIPAHRNILFFCRGFGAGPKSFPVRLRLCGARSVTATKLSPGFAGMEHDPMSERSVAKYIAKSSSIASRMLGGEMMIMSALDSTFFTLNPVASVIWQAADGFTPLS